MSDEEMKVDCLEPSIFTYFYSIVEREESRESWTPAQNGRLGVGGCDREKCCRQCWKKREFPVCLETENSHWLKGDKSVVALTTADYDCFQARFAAFSSCHTDICRDS